MTISSEGRSKYTLFWSIVAGWVIADVLTKAWALQVLRPRVSIDVISDYLRFTLVFNQGAAFGMHIGEWSRWVFTGLTIGALVMLVHLFRETRNDDRVRTLALALVTAGALGNLVDRLRWDRGVVDFIDVGYAEVWRFWTFNVADIGVSCGAVLLAIVLWREEQLSRDDVPAGAARAPEPPPVAAQSADVERAER